LFTVMIIFHTLVCCLLVVVILMQASKGEGLAGAFGGGGTGLTGAVFGGRGAATFLSKATTVLAIVFMVNCGILAFMSSHRTGGQVGTTDSVVTQEAQREMERQAAQQQQQAPPADMTEGDLFQTEGTATGTEGTAQPTGSETQQQQQQPPPDEGGQ